MGQERTVVLRRFAGESVEVIALAPPRTPAGLVAPPGCQVQVSPDGGTGVCRVMLPVGYAVRPVDWRRFATDETRLRELLVRCVRDNLDECLFAPWSLSWRDRAIARLTLALQDLGSMFDVLDEPAMELLARLEEAVNATSLVLLFHVGKSWMLFPADAPWGTWDAILNDPVCARLRDNLSFYNVGHHGSHNATPIRFVERHVGSSAIAMLPYGLVAKWPSIPRAGLLTRLQEKKVVLARSDQTPPAPFSSRMIGRDVLSIDVVLTA